MATVPHMKWWGWGVEGISFHHEDKPKLRPFVQQAVDLDLNTRRPAHEVGGPADPDAGDQR
ncbi:MAG TPA: hypothetical protein VKB85_06245 [Propionibacteriaceae bacterium]|nr:hypothetical protein [Propionibacteriaceae bacterium]